MSSKKPFEIYPIERVDVYDAVLRQLDQLIRDSGLGVGDRLPAERDLVARLGVSRVSVREALRALESLGKIEIRHHQGSFVRNPHGNALAAQLKLAAPMGPSFVEQLIDVRAPIEIRVVELVAGGPANLRPVQRVVDQADAEIDRPDAELGSLDLRFEATLGALCNNPLLRATQAAVHSLWVEAWADCGLAPGNRELLHQQHKAILAAISRRDVGRAARLMREHVDRSMELAPVPPRRRAPK